MSSIENIVVALLARLRMDMITAAETADRTAEMQTLRMERPSLARWTYQRIMDVWRRSARLDCT